MTQLPRSPGSTLVLRLYQETVHDFILLFMTPCGPHLTPLATGSSNEAYLSSSCNLHLQYLAKNQSTQRCQSVITQGGNHPPVLEPHMVLNLPLDECIDNTHLKLQERKEKEKKRTKRNSNKRSKTKQRQRARSLEEDKSRTP
jgi:hypothetical protein